MRRSVLMVGLVAVLGCGAEESQGGDPAAAAATTPVTAQAAPMEKLDEALAPRGERFAPMPAGGLARGSIESLAWSRETRPAVKEAGGEVRGHFDPEQVRVVEAARRAQAQTQTTGGAQ